MPGPVSDEPQGGNSPFAAHLNAEAWVAARGSSHSIPVGPCASRTQRNFEPVSKTFHHSIQHGFGRNRLNALGTGLLDGLCQVALLGIVHSGAQGEMLYGSTQGGQQANVLAKAELSADVVS